MTPSAPVEILIIEDNSHDAELAMRALRKNHLANSVVWVRDGAEALDFFFGAVPPAVAPRVVLLDLKLPKVDGIEVLRRLRTEPATRLLPIVVLTSSREEIDLVRTYELGVNSYIVKPVDFENFSEVVRQLGLYWLLLNQAPEGSAAGKEPRHG